jgi:hypothetical protein
LSAPTPVTSRKSTGASRERLKPSGLTIGTTTVRTLSTSEVMRAFFP